jgi:hypothetical protein
MKSDQFESWLVLNLGVDSYLWKMMKLHAMA